MTRQEARRQKAADPAWQADFCRLKTPKNSRFAKTSKVTKAPRVSKTQRSPKINMPSPIPSPAGPETCVPPLPLPIQATSSSTKVTAAWIDPCDYSNPHFKAIGWDAPSTVYCDIPQESPKAGRDSQAMVFERPEIADAPTHFKKPTLAFLKSKNRPGHSVTSSSRSSTRVASLKKLEVRSISPNSERPLCISPTCPVYPIAHQQGTYLHGGTSPRNHFTFDYSNPPPAVWAAYGKNRHGEATEEDLELVANFRAHHDHRVHAGGIITSGICQMEPVYVRESSFSFGDTF